MLNVHKTPVPISESPPRDFGGTFVQKLRRIFWVDLGETVKFVGFVEMVVRWER